MHIKHIHPNYPDDSAQKTAVERVYRELSAQLVEVPSPTRPVPDASGTCLHKTGRQEDAVRR